MSQTLDNLQAAFNGESNAHAKYLAFAQCADKDGYGAVASLFRAAARAEQIHAQAHAVVIKRMGGVPKADILAPELKGTADNLRAAIAGESYERDVMYPDFIKQAQAEKNSAALRSFGNALAAEAEHAKLYQDALDHLGQWKTARDFFVCIICGYTTTTRPDPKCPVCSLPGEKFETIR